jgi:cytochrome b561
MKNNSNSYTSTAKVLHWLMAILIISASCIGIYGASLTYGVDAAHDAQKVAIITLHKSIATTTLFLIIARVLWRLTHRPPELLGMSPMMAKAAHAGHALLYALMIIVPFSGWANSSSAGYTIPVAGLFYIPRLMEKTPTLTPYLSEFHAYIAWFLLIVVIGHVGFAIKHWIIDRDNTLASMLPGKH